LHLLLIAGIALKKWREKINLLVTGEGMNTLAGILIVIGFFILLAILFWGAVYTPKKCSVFRGGWK